MLILSRKIGETIIIDKNVSVTVMDVSNGQIKLGVNAPKHIAIHREEIYIQIENEVLNEPLKKIA